LFFSRFSSRFSKRNLAVGAVAIGAAITVSATGLQPASAAPAKPFFRNSAEGAALTSMKPNNLEVFSRDIKTSKIVANRWENDQWVGWGFVPSKYKATDAPAATKIDANKLALVTVGKSREVAYQVRTDNKWGDARRLHKKSKHAPAIVSTKPGSFDIFVTSPVSNAVQYLHFENGKAETKVDKKSKKKVYAWKSLGGDATSAPAAASIADNRIDVFVRGANNAVFTRSIVDGKPSKGWRFLSGIFAQSAPAVAAWEPQKRVSVFVQGSDKAIHTLDFRPTEGKDGVAKGGWISIGGESTNVGANGKTQSSPAAVSWNEAEANRIDVFTQAANKDLYHASYERNRKDGPPNWSKWGL
jgi:hypothetical protein